MKFAYPKDVNYEEIEDRMELLSFSIATTPLEIFKGDTLIDEATGFFYLGERDKIFLVTSKHCIFDERFYPDKIVIRLHTDIHDLSKNARREIELYKNGKPIWIEHEDKKVDVAMIEIDKEIVQGCYFACFTKEDIFSTKNPKVKKLVYEFEVGSTLLVVGYPVGLYDRANNLSIHRGAFLASKYTIWFEGKPCFLVDSYLPPGMSGSPVLTATAAFRRTIIVDIPYYLAGILQGPVQTPYLVTQRGLTAVSDIGLYYVWYADLLEEIIKYNY